MKNDDKHLTILYQYQNNQKLLFLATYKVTEFLEHLNGLYKYHLLDLNIKNSLYNKV